MSFSWSLGVLFRVLSWSFTVWGLRRHNSYTIPAHPYHSCVKQLPAGKILIHLRECN